MNRHQYDQRTISPGQERWIFFSLLILLLFLTFKDYLLLHRLYIFKDIGSDSYNQAWPFFTYISNYLKTEGIPRWSFSQGMGQNIFPGEMHNPFNLLLYLMGEDFIPYGIIYVESLKILVGGMIFFYYLRLLQVAPFVQVIGGLLFAFSGYMIVGSGWYGHSTATVFGAFLLFSFEKLVREDVPYYFPIAVYLVCSRSVFYMYTFGLFLLIYAAFRFIDEKGWEVKALFKLYLKMAGLGLLGLGMGCLFTMNDIFRMLESPRGGGGASYAGALKSYPIFLFGNKAHNLTALFSLFSTNILGTGSFFKGWRNYLEAPTFYCGLISLLLVPQFFIFKDKARRTRWLIFLFIWVFIVIFPFFRFAFYLFTGDYYKGGISFIVSMVLLFFSLVALSDIESEKRLHLPILLLTLAVLLFILYFPWFFGNKTPVVEIYRQLSAIFLVVYTFIIYLISKNDVHVAVKYILVGIISLEIAMFSYDTVNKRFTMTPNELHERVGYNDYSVDAISKIKSMDNGFHRVLKDYRSGNAIHSSLNDAEIQDFYGLFSYYSFNQKYYIRFLTECGLVVPGDEIGSRWAGIGIVNRPLLVTFSSVKYLLSKFRLPGFYKSTYKKIDTFNDVTLLQNDYFLPLGITYDHYIDLRQFRALDPFEKDISFFKAFIIEDGENLRNGNGFVRYDIDGICKSKTLKAYVSEEYKKDVQNLKAECMKITENRQNRIVGSISLKKKKLVFFAIPFDKGWQATIDGKKAPLHLVNIGFTGLVVDSGEHEIMLRYEPPFFKAGLMISLLSMALYLCVFFKNHQFNKREK